MVKLTESRRKLSSLDDAGHVEQAKEWLVGNRRIVEQQGVGGVDDALHSRHHRREQSPGSN